MCKNILKIMAGLIAFSFLMAGCATDPYYDTAKTIYKGGKTVYKELDLKNEKIEKVAGYAENYDEARTAVREVIDIEGKNESDADIASPTEP